MRQRHLDSAAGILILYMMMGHAFQLAGMTTNRVYHFFNFLFFFMSWFFFKSGAFLKELSYKKSFAKSVLKLIIPYIIFSYIGFTIDSLYKIMIIHDYQLIHYTLYPIKLIIMRGSLAGNLPLWFLLTLFLCQNIYLVMRTVIKNRYVIAAISLCIGCLLSRISFIHIPFWIGNTFLAVFFYSIGSILKTFQYKKQVFFLSLIGYIVIYVMCMEIVDFRTNRSTSWEGYLLWSLWSICGIIVLNNFTKYMPHINLLSLVGANSMAFFLMHWPLMLFMSFVCNLLAVDFG